eukprot:989686-Pelagomonas_calceolata.AAC.2
MQYALLAAQEALSDAGWLPEQISPQQRASTGVAIGSGMSSCNEIIEAWQLLVGSPLLCIAELFQNRQTINQLLVLLCAVGRVGFLLHHVLKLRAAAAVPLGL